MAEVTVTLPDSAYSQFVAAVEWALSTGRPSLGTTLSPGGTGELFLRSFNCSQVNGQIILGIEDAASGALQNNNDLSDLWESQGHVRVVVREGESNEASFSALSGSDSAEPYQWTPTNFEEVKTFAQTVRNLSAGQREIKVTLSDQPLVTTAPDLIVGAPTRSGTGDVNAGDTVTLTIRVTNQGDGASLASLLSVYRSADSTVDNSDTQVGSNASVNALAPNAFHDISFDVTAPNSNGTFYYGAFVNPVTGESNNNNNFSPSGLAITVVGADTTPDFGSPAIEDFTFKVGDPSIDYQLRGASSGNPPLVYALTGLPTEFSFNAATRRITGIPTTRGTHALVYTATDADGDVATANFNFIINAADLVLVAPENRTLESGSAANFSLPAASGGVTPYIYTVSGLPEGLTFNAATRRITGSTTVTGSRTITYEVEDAQNTTVTRTFSLTITAVQDLMPSLPMLSDRRVSSGQAVDILMPEAVGGNTPLTYSMSGLPTGLMFTPSTRRITGTPTALGVSTVVYNVSDADNDMASGTFSLTVAAANLVPSLPTINTQAGQSGTALNILLPAAMGGDAPIAYTLMGLHAGLTFTPATRRITGTPTETGSRSLTYTATDSDGDIASTSFDLVIGAANQIPVLPNLFETITSINGVVGSPLNFQMPEATGGNAPLSYTLTGFPDTLSFDPTTRRLTGTPSEASSYVLVYTVVDNDGDSDADSVFLSIGAITTLLLNEPYTEPKGPWEDGEQGSSANLNRTALQATTELPAATEELVGVSMCLLPIGDVYRCKEGPAWERTLVNGRIGEIIDYAGADVPIGLLECNGQAVSRSNYADLFAAIGTVWGTGDGTSTFNLPDLRGFVTMGSGVARGEVGQEVGNTGGEATHALATSELPEHSHEYFPTRLASTNSQQGSAVVGTTSTTGRQIIDSGRDTGSVGQDEPHNNMQPTAVVLKCIKY